jgi:photosystem II stability/assembly factor-like uncharacterized protein
MKPFYRTLLLLIPAVAIVAGVHAISSRQESGREPEGLLGAEEESPEGRAHWEWMRLHDPTTGAIPAGIRGEELAFAATMPRREGSAMFKGSSTEDYGWTARGPYNIGGRTRAVALDVTGEDTILAGGVSGGLWRSTDAGRNWSRTTDPSQLQSVTTIVQDTRPGRTNTWYFGSGEIAGPSASGGGDAFFTGNGVYKSTDNGRTWTSLKGTASNTPHTFDNNFDIVWRLALDPSNNDSDEVYAAVYGGIYRSINGGATWNASLIDNAFFSSNTDVAVTSKGVVYATFDGNGGKRGIWRSTDGARWTKITPAIFPTKFNRIVMGIAPSNENVIYFLAETPGSGHAGLNFKKDTVWGSIWKYTYLSGDGSGAGGKWEDRSANLPSLGGSFGDYNPQSSYDMHATVKPDDENVLFIGGTNLYRSNDGFATPSGVWIGGYRNIQLDSSVRIELEYPDHHPDQHFALFSRRNPNVLFTGSDGGVHRTDDAMAANVEWTPLNHGYTTTQFYTIAIDHGTPGDVRTIVGGLQDNGTWMTSGTDASSHWDSVGSGDGSYCAIADGKSSLYVAKQEGKSYRVVLNDQGKLGSYTRIDPRGGRSYLFVSPFALDPSDNRAMYLVSGPDLWRNTDLTAIPMGSMEPATVNWTKVERATLADSIQISALGVSTSAPAHRLYYGTDHGRVYRLDDALTSSAPPADVTPTTFPKNGYVSCIAVDPEDGDRAVVVFSNYRVQSLFLTTDGGASWTPIGGNLEQNPATGAGSGPSCRWFSFLHRPNGTIFFVGTSVGLFSATSLDGTGTTWTLEGPTTIGNVVVDMIDVRQSDGFVVVGTHGGGVYSTTIATLGVDEGSASRAASLKLDGSYPNPVGARSSVRYTIGGTRPLHARLDLFDDRGRLLRTLFDGIREPGAYEASLDARDLSSGAYLLRLGAGSEVVSGAVRVVK